MAIELCVTRAAPRVVTAQELNDRYGNSVPPAGKGGLGRHQRLEGNA